MANFAQRLGDLRTAHNLTHNPLAELLAISPRVYSRWETGDETPHFNTIVRLADILSVSLDELAGRKEAITENTIRNPELNRLYKKSIGSRMVVLDSLIKWSQISKVMAEMNLNPAQRHQPAVRFNS